MKRRLLWVFMWAYWVFMKPTTVKAYNGEMNPVWYRWYRWRWNRSDTHARQAFSILTFKLDEPNPFTETNDWKLWYKRNNPDRTLTRQSIKDRLLSLHMKSKTASVEKEPKLLNDVGGLNRDWTRWYSAVNGASPLKAALAGSQLLAKRGIVVTAANCRFCGIEPSLDRKHEWKAWYKYRYDASQQETDMAYMDKRLKESRGI